MSSRMARNIARLRAERVQFRIRFDTVRFTHTAWGKTVRKMAQPLTLTLSRGAVVVWEATDQVPKLVDGVAVATFRGLPPVDATFFCHNGSIAGDRSFQDKPAMFELKTRRLPELPFESLCRHAFDLSMLGTADLRAYAGREFLFRLSPYTPPPSAGGCTSPGGGATTAAGRGLRAKRLSTTLAKHMPPLKATLACTVSAMLTTQAEEEQRLALLANSSAGGGDGGCDIQSGRVRRCGTDRAYSEADDFNAPTDGLRPLMEESGSMYSEHGDGDQRPLSSSSSTRQGLCCCAIS